MLLKKYLGFSRCNVLITSVINQMFPSYECTDSVFMIKKCIFGSLISVCFGSNRVWIPCMHLKTKKLEHLMPTYHTLQLRFSCQSYWKFLKRRHLLTFCLPAFGGYWLFSKLSRNILEIISILWQLHDPQFFQNSTILKEMRIVQLFS